MELLAIFVALQIADVYTTHRILSQGGRELNPVMAYLFVEFGHLPALLIIKAIVVMVVAKYLIEESYVLGALCAFYLAVVANNARLIR